MSRFDPIDGAWRITLATEEATARLGADISLYLAIGDVVELAGGLGAGKTALARAIINALAPGEEPVEVPSPTFTLVQPYEFTRVPVAHFDFYRLQSAEEVFELGFEDMLDDCAVVLEWADRLGDYLPEDRLEIRLEIDIERGGRVATLVGHGSWTERLARFVAGSEFIAASDFAGHERRFLQGDASTRRYERLCGNDGGEAIFMDMPPRTDTVPVRGGKPYSQIAHLADDVESFVAMALGLRSRGLNAPEIYASDLDQGFLLIEDYGDRVFGSLASEGEDIETAYSAATDVLVELALAGCTAELPVDGGAHYRLSSYDEPAFQIEASLLLDWFWPLIGATPVAQDERDAFEALWHELFGKLDGSPPVWVLRDYHSPNLMWLPERRGTDRIGLLDFQDAVMGPPAYDLVSLLQDARIDVARERERRYFDHYVQQRSARDPSFDEESFARDYAIMGAQRATKILGIFARLKARDGKAQYLRHLPRVSEYLERNLKHPDLAPLKAWFDRCLPHEERVAAAGRVEASV